MLEVENISVFRGERLVLDRVGFTLEAGSALLLTGPNGAGKSTLLRVLAGLRKPEGGHVLWSGVDTLADRSEHASRVAYLGHQDALKPGLTLRENLTLAARSGGGDPDSCMKSLNILGLADLPARMLSAGQKRRAALARVLLARAPLWLLDEPSLGLDMNTMDLLGTLFAAHRQAGGIVIATTHVPLPLPNARTLALPGLNESDIPQPMEDFPEDDLL
ncbi:heme ABC exporter ATP-binding protein CcmA [Komagataeibacter melaceti]|uniref:Heme ABC exporter ATP-binding protein CcmA n=1 Tax=Komagataeibacter melaceti TaxID=2766577 RepID=A0A371YYE5_9PROT|nr:heme ABC exporter ATP-binding protein CcmA [Komagataeibacter melaceti]RFD19247.1 heme ABC exporter ATP-binding protein CcmA [Komagataeibacter melaceti]